MKRLALVGLLAACGVETEPYATRVPVCGQLSDGITAKPTDLRIAIEPGGFTRTMDATGFDQDTEVGFILAWEEPLDADISLTLTALDGSATVAAGCSTFNPAVLPETEQWFGVCLRQPAEPCGASAICGQPSCPVGKSDLDSDL